MFIPVIVGLIVSIDAFFIGLSLGMQKKCKFIYLAIINAFLLGLCILGFIVAGQIYELIPFDPDIVVGLTFIALGIWTILHFFISKHIKRHRGTGDDTNASIKTFAIIGIVMSLEAMLITMGITLVFLPESTLIIPLIVAIAHFGYSTLAFYLTRIKRIQQIPVTLSYIISGSALIIYGMMAIFAEFGDMII